MKKIIKLFNAKIDNIKRSVSILNFIKLFSSDLVSKIINMVVVFYLASVLTVTKFGEYSYILKLVNLFVLIIDPFANSYLREYKHNNELKYNFSFNLFSILLFIPFSLMLNRMGYNVGWIVFTVYFLFLIIRTNMQTYYNLNNSYNLFSIINILIQLTMLSYVIVNFAILKRNITPSLIIVEGYLIVDIVLIIFALISIKKEKVEIVLKLKKIINVILESRYLILYLTIIPIISFCDMYFIQNRLTNFDLGLYSFSLKIFNMTLAGIGPMLTLMRIKQIEIFHEDNTKNFYIKYFKNNLFIATTFIVVIVIGSTMLTYFFFNQYIRSLFSTYTLILTCYVSYVTVPFNFLLASKKYKTVFKLSIYSLALNIMINLIFIDKHGIIIAAISTFVSQTFLNGGMMIISYNKFVKSEN